MDQKNNQEPFAFLSESGKAANYLLIVLMLAIGAFSAYVLFTTENTTIVINEAAAEPQEEEVVNNTPPPQPAPPSNPQIEILETGVGFLNVRDSGSLQGTKVGEVEPGEVYEYTVSANDWYKIAHPELEEAWVSGQYVQEVEPSEESSN